MSGREPERRTAAVWRERLAALFRRYQYALLVAAVGVVLMLLPAVGGGSDQETPERQAAQTVDFGTEALEGRLEDALSRMEGVGQADVVLTLRSGPGQVLAQDTKLAARETPERVLPLHSSDVPGLGVRGAGGGPTAFAPISGGPCGMLGRGRSLGASAGGGGGRGAHRAGSRQDLRIKRKVR